MEGPCRLLAGGRGGRAGRWKYLLLNLISHDCPTTSLGLSSMKFQAGGGKRLKIRWVFPVGFPVPLTFPFPAAGAPRPPGPSRILCDAAGNIVLARRAMGDRAVFYYLF